MKAKTIAPKIHVYHIARRLPPLWRQPASRRIIMPGFLMVALLIGLSGGAWLSWNSRIGQADLAGQVQGVTTDVPSTSPVIPLEFDQSELNVVADLLPVLIEQNRHEPTAEELAAAQRKEKLRTYLAYRKSPLAKEDSALDALLHSKNMKMMIAISFVESNMCKRQIYFNCSGIGGSKMRQYPNFAGWIDDFDKLLERRYKGLAVEDFIGYYVQPGSDNWKNGVYQILGELKARGIE